MIRHGGGITRKIKLKLERLRNIAGVETKKDTVWKAENSITCKHKNPLHFPYEKDI